MTLEKVIILVILVVLGSALTGMGYKKLCPHSIWIGGVVWGVIYAIALIEFLEVIK